MARASRPCVSDQTEGGVNQKHTRDTHAQGKTITGNLQGEFDAADETLVIMDDLTGQITNAKFTGDYNNARIIVDISTSHASPAQQPAPQPLKAAA